MRLRPGSFALTAMLGVITALGSISNDTYLPSLPAISVELNASPETVQLTLSAFLVGFAIGQIGYGPLSDKFGRKSVLMWGFAVFLIATAICMTAPSIEVLILGRVLQSLGAAGPIILARAIVRDLHEGARAARELSVMASVMGVSPILAPVIGGVLQDAFGWRASFIFVACLGAAIAAACAIFLPETLKLRQTGSISFRSVLRSYGAIWRNRPFRAYAAMLTACYSGLFAYVSASSFVLQDIYGLSAIGFSFAFASCSIAFVLGSLGASRLAIRRGLEGAIAVGVRALAVGGALQLALCLWRPGDLLSVLAPETAFMAGVGLSMPQLLAAAMTPFPDRAGAASSLLGVIQMTGAAIVGALLGAFLGHSPLPFAATTASAGLASLGLHLATRRSRRREPA